MAIVCNTAGAAIAGLGAGTAGIAAHFTAGAAVSTDASIGSRACGATTADAGVIAPAGVAMGAVAVGATLVAGSVAAVLARSTAGGSRGAVAVAAGVSHTADRRWVHVATLCA